MTGFTTKLFGFGIAVGLLVLPTSAGAEYTGQHFNHRFFTQEAIERMQYDPTADYMMLERSPLEEIAGRDNLDWETIVFLEDNLWDYDIRAYGAGAADDADIGIHDGDPPLPEGWVDPYFEGETDDTGVGFDPDLMSEEELWFWEQNTFDYEDNAGFEGDADETGIGVFAIDPDAYSEEIFWQDAVEESAEFAETDAQNLFPEADDVPQLRAGELNY